MSVQLKSILRHPDIRFVSGSSSLASTLIAMRHAHAEFDTDLPDEKRPLTEAGRDLARSTGRLLAKLDHTPDLIVTSSATRATETANLIAEVLHPIPRVVNSADLYLAPAQVYLPVLFQEVRDESTVLVVGHNPGVGVLMRDLADDRFSVSPGTACVFSFASDWSELKGMPKIAATMVQLIINGKVFE